MLAIARPYLDTSEVSESIDLDGSVSGMVVVETASDIEAEAEVDNAFEPDFLIKFIWWY